MPQIKKWIKENWKFLLKEIFVWSIAPIIILFLVIFYSVFIVLSVEALKALVQAEATIFGFFGIVVAYLFKAIDDKEDKYEQMLFDAIMTDKSKVIPDSEKIYLNPYGEGKSRETILREAISRVREHKHKITKFLFTVGVYMVVSILLSIAGIALIETVILSAFLVIFAMMLFFVAVIQFLLLFRNMAKLRPRIFIE